MQRAWAQAAGGARLASLLPLLGAGALLLAASLPTVPPPSRRLPAVPPPAGQRGPRPAAAVDITLAAPDPHQVVQRGRDNVGTFVVRGRAISHRKGQAIDQVQVQGRYVALRSGDASEWLGLNTSRDAPVQHGEATFAGEIRVPAGWHRLEFRVLRATHQVAALSTVEPVGVGEVFITAGQSNAANYGGVLLASRDPRVSAWGPDGWRRAKDPQPFADGSGGSPWPALGDLLAQRWDVPIGFLSVGVGGTRVEQWLPGGALFPRLTAALTAADARVRAVLWHQGEGDLLLETPAARYAAMLSQVIAACRDSAGFKLPWIVARASFLPCGTRPPCMCDAQVADGGQDTARCAQAKANIIGGQEQVIEDDAFAFPGPSTDELTGVKYRHDQIHLNELGLRTHAALWDAAIAAANWTRFHQGR